MMHNRLLLGVISSVAINFCIAGETYQQEPTSEQNPIILFLHPFRLSGSYIEKYQLLLPQDLVELSPDGPDALDTATIKMANKRIDEAPNWFKKKVSEFQKSQILSTAASRSSLAQDGDIYTVLSHLHEHDLTHHHKIIIGDSKGASLAINLLGSGLLEYIDGIVAISPFYHTTLAMQDFNGIPHHWFINKYLMPFAYRWYLPHVTPNGIQPCTSVKNIAQHASNTPILIVAIMNDTLVPAYQQLALYIRLKELGCHVYILIVDDADHANIGKCAAISTIAPVILSFWRDACGVPPRHFSSNVPSIIQNPCYTPSIDSIRLLMYTKFQISPEELDRELQLGS